MMNDATHNRRHADNLIHIMPRCPPPPPPSRRQMELCEDDWSNVSNDAKDVVRRLLHPDPRKRATVDDVLAMAWLGHHGRAQRRRWRHDQTMRGGSFRA